MRPCNGVAGAYPRRLRPGPQFQVLRAIIVTHSVQKEAAAFLASADGLEFVRIAATGWAAAAVADGDDPPVAWQAAERTVALYTTPPEAASRG